jgi:NADH dehydrogenase (ubiquinone) Fe-S protein 1
MFTIEINGELYKVPANETIIQSCYRIGIEIPRFCYHEKLSIAGNCRMCLVEVGYPKSIKPIASCALPVVDFMKIYTNTLLVKKARESVLEFLLANHPLDCPICDQGGECDLQDETMFFGSDKGRFYEIKRSVSDKECGPLIKTVMTRCIHCTRCVRFFSEIVGVEFLGVVGRGSTMEIGTFVENFIDSEISGNVIDLCPVGALTSKPYSFVARPWELRAIQTVDILDSFCSSIRVDVRGSEIVRILPLMHTQSNEEWISDRTRFFYDGLKRQRLQVPLIRVNFGKFISLGWERVFSLLGNVMKYFIVFNTKRSEANEKKNVRVSFFRNFSSRGSFSSVIGVLGKLADAESIVSFKDFLTTIGSENFFFNLDYKDFNFDLRFNYLFLPSFFGEKGDIFLCADIIVLVNFNPRLEMPILNIKLRKLFLEKGVPLLLLGSYSHLNFFFFHIASNARFVLDLLEGRNFFCRKLVGSHFPLFLCNINFLERRDCNFFFNAFLSLKKYINILSDNWIGLIYFALSVGNINALELGFAYNIKTKMSVFPKYDFFFFLGSEIEPFFRKVFLQNFSVYQGHHADELTQFADIILPSVLFVEKNGLYLNFQGFLKRTKKILNSPGLSREDWQILASLFAFFVKFFEINWVDSKSFLVQPSLSKVYQRLNSVSPHFLHMSSSRLDFFSLSFFDFFLQTKTLVYNILLSKSSFFFYMNDPISKSSKILALCTQKFVLIRNNFLEIG